MKNIRGKKVGIVCLCTEFHRRYHGWDWDLHEGKYNFSFWESLLGISLFPFINCFLEKPTGQDISSINLFSSCSSRRVSYFWPKTQLIFHSNHEEAKLGLCEHLEVILYHPHHYCGVEVTDFHFREEEGMTWGGKTRCHAGGSTTIVFLFWGSKQQMEQWWDSTAASWRVCETVLFSLSWD